MLDRNTGHRIMAASSPRPAGCNLRAVIIPVSTLAPTTSNFAPIGCSTAPAALRGVLCGDARGESFRNRGIRFSKKDRSCPRVFPPGCRVRHEKCLWHRKELQRIHIHADVYQLDISGHSLDFVSGHIQNVAGLKRSVMLKVSRLADLPQVQDTDLSRITINLAEQQYLGSLGRF